MHESETLVLGAGPAGMAAAVELANAGRKIAVVEKADGVGGLARTLEYREPEGTYRTDIGPHRFFSKNRKLYEMIEDLLGEEWREVPRYTRFFVDGKFYQYPVRLSEVLRKIGPLRAVRFGFDFLWERVKDPFRRSPPRTFQEYTVRQFGYSLAAFNMLNYTEKIWGIPCSEISVDWATQRIQGLTVWSTLKKALFGKKTSGPKSLVDVFFYPANGTGTIYERMRERIESKGNPVLTNSEPTVIRREGNRVTAVEVRTPEGTMTFTPQQVISSVPVPVATRLFDPPPPKPVLEAAKALRFRAQVYLFLTVNRERITRDNWVYFPDTEIPFGRISEMKNFSERMCPPGKTSLFVEFFCFEGDAIWNASKDELFGMAMDVLERLGFLDRKDVLHVHHLRRSHVYPIYDLEYAERVKTIMDWLDGLQNFYAIGRPGRFRYTNQDHSLEMGLLAAESVLSGVRQDIGGVGAEKEYYEKGKAPE